MEVGAAPSEEDLDDRDVKILTSTEELIGEMGYDRVRLIDIADRSGVSVGSLQHRYRTREGLLRAAVERVAISDIPEMLGPSGQVTDPYERLLVLLEHSLPLIDPAKQGSLLWLELVVVAGRNRELAEVLAEGNAVWVGAFHEAFEEGLASGRLTSGFDAGELTTAFVALCDGYLVQRILDPGGTDPQTQVEFAVKLLNTLVQAH